MCVWIINNPNFCPAEKTSICSLSFLSLYITFFILKTIEHLRNISWFPVLTVSKTDFISAPCCRSSATLQPLDYSTASATTWTDSRLLHKCGGIAASTSSRVCGQCRVEGWLLAPEDLQSEMRLLVGVGRACVAVVRTKPEHTMGEHRVFVIQFGSCYTHLCAVL